MAWHLGAGVGLWMVFGGFLWVIVWGMLIYLGVSFLRSPQAPSLEQADAIDIAKRRYASGEITSDEFERIRRDLAA